MESVVSPIESRGEDNEVLPSNKDTCVRKVQGSTSYVSKCFRTCTEREEEFRIHNLVTTIYPSFTVPILDEPSGKYADCASCWRKKITSEEIKIVRKNTVVFENVKTEDIQCRPIQYADGGTNLGDVINQEIERASLGKGYSTLPLFWKLFCSAGNIFEGLERIADHGILHRDIKPANVVYKEDANELRLIDFGIGISTNALRKYVMDVYNGSGTYGYMPPEVRLTFTNTGDLDAEKLETWVSRFQAFTGKQMCKYDEWRFDDIKYPRTMNKDYKKYDTYSWGMVLMETYFKLNAADASYDDTNINLYDRVALKMIASLIRDMVHPFAKKRVGPAEAHLRYKIIRGYISEHGIPKTPPQSSIERLREDVMSMDLARIRITCLDIIRLVREKLRVDDAENVIHVEAADRQDSGTGTVRNNHPQVQTFTGHDTTSSKRGPDLGEMRLDHVC